MNKLRLALVAIFSLSLLSFQVPALVLAQNPFQGVDCTARHASESPVCQAQANPTTQNPLTGANGLVVKIANIIATVAGVAAVIIIILAGLRFITASGSSEDIAGARRTIIYAMVGLIIIVVARSLVALILSKL